ncbi:MAG: cobalt-precorrin-6A reductase [Paracoccaceae bacterium]|jgi:precorrin-6A/cobalt-precorrin-6A reductase
MPDLSDAKLLILGGTREATQLAYLCAEMNVSATISYAGRVERVKPQVIDHRVGGFGGVKGLAYYIAQEQITHVVDATHPFAAQMSDHAVRACAMTGRPLCALTRAAWEAQAGDRWLSVPSIEAAVATLVGRRRTVFLAIGRMHIDQFAAQPQHRYILRLVDPPKTEPLLPDHVSIISRGPFEYDDDVELMRKHRVDVIVSKNAGGLGARSKIDAARDLGKQVIMIDRPAVPARVETFSAQEALEWVAAHSGGGGAGL